MIKNLALILVLSFSLNKARGEGLDAKIEQLDILAVELLGMPLATLQSLISIGERGVFVPEYSLQEGAEMNQYRRLEAEAFYLSGKHQKS